VPSYTVERVPDEVAEYCQRIGRPMVADKGDVLVREGEPAVKAYYVKRGYAKVFSDTASGRHRLLGFIGPQDVIGLGAAHSALGEDYLATAVAATTMDLQMWTREFALSSAAHRPELQQMLDALLVRGLHTILARIHTVSGGHVLERVAGVLLELAERHGEIDSQGITLKPRVTREDLASLVGATLSTVSRLLADWENAGIIKSHRGRIRLLQVERLREWAKT
jgi:CRP-like cAMP-binding protein